MKLQAAQTDGQNIFTAYGDGYVSINAIRHQGNLIALPDRVISDWTPAGFDDLKLADFELLAALPCEVILLGTGKQTRFPRPELLQPLIEVQKGLEVMSVDAACRTYNLLISEGRQVAAALILS